MWDKHLWVALAAFVIVACGPLLLRELRFRTLTGTPLSNADTGELYQDGVNRFGEGCPLTIVLKRHDVMTTRFDGFTDALADAMRAWPDIRLVQSQTLPRESRDASAWRLGVVLANSADETRQTLLSRLTRKEMHKQLRRSRKKLLMAKEEERDFITADLLDVGSLIMPFYTSRLKPGAFAPSMYFDAPDGNSRLVFVYPTVTAEDAPYAQDLLTRTRAAIERLQHAHQAESIQVAITGRHALAADGTVLLQKELSIITLIAGSLLLLLFWAVFRNLPVTLLCGLPVAVSMSAVIVLICLAFNPVDMIAMGFAAIILGLSIDVTIHCVGRLHQMLGSEVSVREATIRTIGDCGPPIFIGVTTTASAFLCLGFAKFSGMRQFGFLAASGLILSLVSSLAIFPAAVRWLYGRIPPAKAGLRYHLFPRHFFSLALLHPRTALALAAVVVAVSVTAATKFRFDMRIETTFPTELPAMETATEVSEQHGTAFAMSTRVWLKAASLADAMRQQRKLDAFLVEEVKAGRVAGFESPSVLLQYPDESGETPDIAPSSTAEDAVRQEYLEALQGLGFGAGEDQSEYIATLCNAVQMFDQAPGWPTAPDLLPQVSRFAKRDEGQVYLQTLIWPPGDMGDMGTVKELSSTIRAIPIDKGVEMTVSSAYEAYEAVNKLIKSDFRRVSLIALVVVGLLIFGYFRRITTTLLALIPMGAAIPFTFGFLHITGQPFTPSGTCLVALLIGIGIDDAVHILTRIHEHRGKDLKGLLEEIGPVLSLTTASTMIGFGALLVSRYRTTSVLGLAVAIGVVACLFFTFLIIPACLALRPSRKGAGALLVLLLVSGMAQPVMAGDDDAAMKIIERLQKRYEGTETISCRFEQRRKIEQLAFEMQLSGIMLFQKPSLLRLELRGDENLDLWANNENVWIHDLDLEEVESYRLSTETPAERIRDLLPLVFNHSPGDLPKQFDITVRRTEDGFDRLTLSPKPTTDVAWKEADLDLDRWGRMKRMESFYSEFDYTIVTFHEWKRHKPLDPDTFKYGASTNTPLLQITGLDTEQEPAP